MGCVGILNCPFSYSQLAMIKAQVCLSIGYSFRFIGQDRVNEILVEEKSTIRAADWTISYS